MPMVDFYSVLGIDRKATPEEIKSAYKKLAIKWHPDKNPNNRQEAEDKFKQISEAYQTLIDPQSRAKYDQYGEEGLRQPPADGDGAYAGEGSNVRVRFRYRSPDDLFSEFFGGASPFGSIFGGGGFGGPFGDSFFSSPLGGARMSSRPTGPRKAPPIQRKLTCSLEELYTGCVRPIQISKRISDPSGASMEVTKELEVIVAPGTAHGDTLLFPEEGDEMPNEIPADLIFVIEQQPHKSFQRRQHDLLYKAVVSLKDALTGCKLEIPTLDGRIVTLKNDKVISPGSTTEVPGEGMPSKHDPSRKGKLVVEFSVQFPPSLSEKTKAHLRTLL